MNLNLQHCNMEALYQVQSDKGQKVRLEGLSRAFGLLLQVCGIKTRKETVTKICKEVSDACMEHSLSSIKISQCVV